MLKKYSILFLLSILISVSTFGQFSDIRGKVTDGKESLSIAYVKLSQGAAVVKQINVSVEGDFIISDLQPGDYTLEVSAMSFGNYVQPFQLGPNESKYFKVVLKNKDVLSDSLKEMVIFGIKEIEDDPPVDGDKIVEGPYKGIGEAITADPNIVIVNGRPQKGDARSGQLEILNNGTTQIGPLAPTTFSLGQVRVLANGIPAMYGDFVGGAVEYTNTTFLDTVSRKRALFRTSSPFNAYHQNAVETFLYKPLISEEGKTTLGLTHSLFLGYDKDPNPTIVDVYRLSDSSYQSFVDEPFTSSGVVKQLSPSSFTTEDFNQVGARPNVASKNYYTSLGLSFKPNDDLLMTLTPSIQYVHRNQFSFSNSLLNSQHNPLNTSITGKVNFQLSHTLKQPYSRKGELLYDNSLLSKINYTIIADYQHLHSETKDPIFKDDIFQYGYLGKFTTTGQDRYTYVNRQKTVHNENGEQELVDGYYEWQGYQIEDVQYEANSKNEARSAITESAMRQSVDFSSLTDITQNLGLLNGQNPNSIFGMYHAPGTVISNYSKSDVQKTNINAIVNLSINPTRKLDNQHDVQIGLMFEERRHSYYSLNANSLWQLMPQLVNNQFYRPSTGNEILSYDEHGMFTDTVRYFYSVDKTNQSHFDQSLRQIVDSENGYQSGGAHFLNVHEVDPSKLELSMFTADELWNNGSSSVNYAGYDYLGNKLRNRYSISDFLNNKDDRFINGHSPNYMAVWLQDKFVLEKLKIRAGVRIERYDANQQVLKDAYSLYPIKSVAEVNMLGANVVLHPNTVSTDAKVYVNNMDNPTEIVGYRDGNQWYDANGVELAGGELLRQRTDQGVIQPFLVDPDNQELSGNSFEDYNPEIIVLPRLSISFPVTSTGLFYAYYDKFAQRPSFAQSFAPINTYYYLENASSTLLPNASLKPTKRTDYQLGYKQALGRYSTLNLMAGYADIKDDINLISVEQAYPRSYITYGNIDFATVKKFGVDYTFDNRTIDINVSYLLQFADGTGSNANSAASLIQAGQPNLRSLYPLAYDVRHKLNANTSITLDRIFTSKYFRQSRISIYANTQSGLPFTALTTAIPEAQNLGTVSRSQIKGNPFGSRMPWNYNIDLSLSKTVLIKKKPVVIQLNALNIFNLRNVQNVYAATASATDDGYLTSAVGQQQIAREQNAQSFVEYYNLKLNNPSHFGAPRMLSLTLRTAL